jgi:hypothetical protein
LLTWIGKLLSLTLNRKVDQQRPELKQLLPVHDSSIQSGAATQAFVLTSPLPRQDQITAVIVELMLLKPTPRSMVRGEGRFNHGAITTRPHQPTRRRSLNTTKESI